MPNKEKASKEDIKNSKEGLKFAKKKRTEKEDIEIDVEADETSKESEIEESKADEKEVKEESNDAAKPDKKDEQIAELKDKVMRQMAEFDNYRKRSEKEKSQMFETGVKSTVEKILPVIDNFERGLAAIPEEEKGSSFAEGMDKIYKQMMTVFDEMGIKPIEAVGKEFDPNLHNAVMHIDDENLAENTIVEEFQKGYMYNDQVVRHSMVKVAN